MAPCIKFSLSSFFESMSISILSEKGNQRLKWGYLIVLPYFIASTVIGALHWDDCPVQPQLPMLVTGELCFTQGFWTRDRRCGNQFTHLALSLWPSLYYRASHVLVDWVLSTWISSVPLHCLPDSAWADGNLAEAAGQLGKMVEHRNQSQPNPGLRAHGTPCII